MTEFKFGDDAPESLTNLLEFVEENSGLRGSETVGTAKLSVGGSTVMLTSDRPSFDQHSDVREYIEADDDLTIRHIGVKSVRGGNSHPYLEVTTA